MTAGKTSLISGWGVARGEPDRDLGCFRDVHSSRTVVALATRTRPHMSPVDDAISGHGLGPRLEPSDVLE